MKVRKIKNKENIYILSPQHAFYSLVYHALIHKNYIATNYYTDINILFHQLGLAQLINIKSYLYPFDAYFKLLQLFMLKYNYTFIKPVDQSVYYNTSIASIDNIRKYLEKNYFFKEIEGFMLNMPTSSGYTYLKAYKTNQKLFIKWGGDWG